MLSLSAIAKAEKNKLSTDSAFIILLDICFEEPIRICYNIEDVIWNGNLYQAFPFSLGEVGEDSTGSDPNLEIQVDNVSQALQYYVEEAGGGNNTEVIVRVVNSKALDEATAEAVLLNFGYKSIALVILNTVFNLGTLLLNYVYCKQKLHIKLKFGKIDIKLLKEIMAYSVWIFLNSIMDKINWNVDQFILGTISGTTVVAIYSVASQLNQMYLNFSTAIAGVMLPKVAKMEEQKATDEEFSQVFIQTGRIQYMVMALIMSGFVLYGQEFINLLWVGPEYSQSYIIACILMLPLTIPLIQNVGLNIIQAKNQYKFRVIVLFVFAIFNLIVTVFLAKLYGGIGAAIGTSLSIICGQIIFMNIFYYKKTHINIPEFWKNILKMSIPVLVVAFFGVIIKKVWPIDNNLKLVIQILIYTVLYLGIMWKFGTNQYEKELVTKPLNKLFKK